MMIEYIRVAEDNATNAAETVDTDLYLVSIAAFVLLGVSSSCAYLDDHVCGLWMCVGDCEEE
jgi:hypothetical protein